MPCGYYHHPSSAACFPAPSGCRLRRLPGLRRGSAGARPGSTGQTGAPSMQATGRTFDPPESGPFILEFGATKIVILWCDLAAQTHGFLYYIKNSFKRDAFKSGALVPMTLGYRIPATDSRKKRTKERKNAPKTCSGQRISKGFYAGDIEAVLGSKIV